MNNGTPMEKYLKKIKYHEEYTSVYFPPSTDEILSSVYGKFDGGYLTLPKGMSGEKLLLIRKELEKEYKKYEGKNSGMEECIKRGAL